VERSAVQGTLQIARMRIRSLPQQRKPRLLLVVAISLLVALAGCAAHRSRSVYHLSEINSEYFLLSPDALDSQEQKQVLHIPRIPNQNNSNCSIKGPWFSFYPVPEHNSWIVETPAASAWERSGGSVDMKDEWQNFEAALDRLQQRRCFSSLDEYLSVQQRIAQSLSAPAEDSLFYRYAYGPGGYVDLAPGMQLRIERDFFGSSADYRGTWVTYYDVTANAENQTKLKFLRIDKKSLPPAPGSPTPEATLTERFTAASRLRLFLQDLVITGNAKTPAILIGGSNAGDLNAVTQSIENDPKVTCADLKRPQVTCAFFDGTVTVSPMIQVVLNGAPTYVPIGSKLWFVIPHVSKTQEAALIRTLRLARSYQGRATEVQFARDEDAISQLLLFGGDKISWSKTHHAPPGNHRVP
jgi:hypothetical protein